MQFNTVCWKFAYFIYNVYTVASVRQQQCKWCIELRWDTTAALDRLWCNGYIFQHTEVSSWHDMTETDIFTLLPIYQNCQLCIFRYQRT